MKEGFRQCMAWLHTWTGLVVGWLLFFIFVTGTAGYFYLELDRWMRPELPLRAPAASPETALASAQSYLTQHADGADFWLITLQGGRASPNLSVTWRDPPQPGKERSRSDDRVEVLDPLSGEAIGGTPRETGGGRLLYRMHYELHYLSNNTARLLVMLSSMIMLVAIISGVITHKKIFKDFFTFRPGKGQRSWLDAHNVIGVVALPFFVMITYSGLMFFMFQYMPGGVAAVYGMQQRGEFFDELYADTSVSERSGAAPLLPMTQLLDPARKEWGPDSVSSILVRMPGDASAEVTLYRQNSAALVHTEELKFHGVSGDLIASSWAGDAARTTQDVMFALHEATFAGNAVRWLYFASGLLGVGMVGTGLVVWTVKRRPQHEAGALPFGHMLVERLNVGTVTGLPVAVAAYFWANRLIPADFAGRLEWESHALFITWGLMFLHPVFRPLMKAWVEQLWLAAAAFALLPLINALTTDRHLGVTLPHGDWVLAGCDLTMFAIGALFAWAAFKVQRRRLTASATSQDDESQLDGPPERCQSAR